jgi:formate dehydrogenase accessory protein FdhD
MFDRATIRKETGGMHSAGLADRNGVRYVYEDVERHNAIDKAIGRGLIDRVDFSRCCLFSSGRIAADMAAKAIAAGIPIFVSRNIVHPSHSTRRGSGSICCLHTTQRYLSPPIGRQHYRR